MTDKELTIKLRGLGRDDIEESHVEADKLLCEILIDLGYTESVKVYKAIPKWYA